MLSGLKNRIVKSEAKSNSASEPEYQAEHTRTPYIPQLETVTAQDTIVHLSYDPEAPPAHPGSQWTRFVCLSDTHSERFSVPLGDVLLHSGDLSSIGKTRQLKVTMDWINSLPHPTKILIAGNHDLSLDSEWYESNWDEFHRRKEDTQAAEDLMVGEEARNGRVTYLEYSSVEIQPKKGGRRWKVYGSPGSPWFGGWAFNYERGDDADDLHQDIPSDTDILLTHGPPHLIHDMVHNGDHVGCEELAQRLDAIRPALHIFGHIHEDRGVSIHEWPQPEHAASAKQRTVYVNAANFPSGKKTVDLRDAGASISVGGPGFQPIIVDLFDPVTEAQ